MSEGGQRCETCGTHVSEGAAKCPGCGRVFGEQNRCPHCHAVAGVLKRGPATVCAACGKARTGVLIGRAGREVDGPTRAMMSRASGRGKRAFGILSLSAGVLAAVGAAVLFPGSLGIGLAIAAGVIGAGVGGLSIRGGARSMQEADEQERRTLERQLLALAAEEGGRLTAAHAAEVLSLEVDAADDALTAMVGDGSRVDVDVSDEGEIEYVFSRLVAKAASRVRVEPVTEDAEDTRLAEVEAGEASSEARRERRGK
ncbi:MAG: hypothetical protein AB8I08_40665 [Sandaracinaceae bacterium]